MEFGSQNSTHLVWRSAPELLINEESLVEVIQKLRSRVQALESNELLSGSALPSWLLKALTEVASNVDAVVECHALKEQVSQLQKEILDLRHEMLIQRSTAGSGANTGMYNPTPHHRLSTGISKMNSVALKASPSDAANGTSTESDAGILKLNAENKEGVAPILVKQNFDQLIKPIWDHLHKQTNEFSSLTRAFQEAKDTVNRLQSEIKRRDAVVQARNNKHEDMMQSQMDKLNESLRACVTTNDLISAEQRIAHQLDTDRHHMMDEVEDRSNKILEDLLKSRSEQEDINSNAAEGLEIMNRRHNRLEDLFNSLTEAQADADERTQNIFSQLQDTNTKVEINTSAVNVIEEKLVSFEETEKLVEQLIDEVRTMQTTQASMRNEIEQYVSDKVAETVETLREEISVINNALSEVQDLNLDSELKSISTKVDLTTLSISDTSRKLAALHKHTTEQDAENATQFTNLLDSVERGQQNMSSLSEESMRLAYGLQRLVETTNTMARENQEYRTTTDGLIEIIQSTAQGMQDDMDKSFATTDTEISMLKTNVFQLEDTTSAIRRDLESTQSDVDRNFRTQHTENMRINESLSDLHTAKEEMVCRQDKTDACIVTFQTEIRTELQECTDKLVAIVDKESNRVEALYASFQHKQEQFQETVARSSVRNMDLVDMNRELERLSDSFVSECWKFEISARSSSKQSTRSGEGNNKHNSVTRKQFNERQQQLIVKNCQFFADLIVARAEHEVLLTGSNKEVVDQNQMEVLMLENQTTLIDRIKGKIKAKIMNNKNIGEQFDKSSLDRREIYIQTLYNMMDASMKRRTMGGFNVGSAGGEDDGQTSLLQNATFLDAKRLAATPIASSHSRRVSSMSNRRKFSGSSDSISTPELLSDLESSRSAFSPNSTSVYRGGFRMPKATGSSRVASKISNSSRGDELEVLEGLESVPDEDIADPGFDTKTSIPNTNGDPSVDVNATWANQVSGERGSMVTSQSLPAL